MEMSCHFHAASLPGKKPSVHTGQEAAWAPEPVWTRWCRETFPALIGTRTPDHPARRPDSASRSLFSSFYQVSSKLSL